MRPAAWAVAVLAAGGPAYGQLGGLKVEMPRVDLNPAKIDPFNRNSEIRKAGREIDKRGRQSAGDLSEDVKAMIRRAEHYTSEKSFFEFKDHVFSKNTSRRSVYLKPGTLHHKMIAPALGGRLKVEDVPFTFGAYVPGDMAAITFADRVFVDDRHRPDDPYQALLLAHELAHSAQYKEMGGEKAFARRYMGQIMKEARSFTHVKDWHDALDLERDANRVEEQVGEHVKAVVSVGNKTDTPVSYAVRRRDGGKWEVFTLQPGKRMTHWAGFGHGTEWDIRFDHLYATGYQEKAYDLDFDVAIAVREPTPADSHRYTFTRSPDNKGVVLTDTD